MSAALHLVQELGGPRLYIGDDGLHAGDALELEFRPGLWIAGRYEYSITERGTLRPTFHCGYACGHADPRTCDCELAMLLPLNARVRRPERRR